MLLWLRHTDADVLLQFDATASAATALVRPFAAVRGPARPLLLRSDREVLSLGADGLFYYVDLEGPTLWQIAADGLATRAAELNGCSSVLSCAVAGGQGRLYMLSGSGPQNVSHGFVPDSSLSLVGEQPMLIRVENSKATALDRSRFRAPDNVPLQSLHPDLLINDRTPDAWITYDRASGQLLRVKIERQ